MREQLHVLHVEDLESDASLIRRVLEKAGYDVSSERVEDEAQMREALIARPWDLVICDFNMPQFDAPTALRVLQATGLDIPFIVVSGVIGEDVAVSMMRAGAHDYLMKDRLARLPAAVRREIGEARVRAERREAQAALRKSESLLRAVCDNTDDCILLKDLEGRIVFANPAALRAMGKIDGEVIGRTHAAVLADTSLATPIVESDRQVAERGEVQVVEEIVPTPIGNRVYMATKSPWSDGNGHVAGVVTISRDITERKRALTALRRSEERERARANELEAIMDALPLAAFISRDPECQTVLGNRKTYETLRLAAGTSLFTLDPSTGAAVPRIRQAGADVPLERLPMQLAARTRSAIENYSCEFVLNDGHRRQMLGNAVPLLDPDGNSRGSVAAFLDITEWREAEQALARTNDHLQRFASAASHDLREPLRTINAFTVLLSRRYAGQLDSDADLYIHFVCDAAQRMERMLDDLLDYSRVGSPSSASITRIPVEAALAETLSNLQALIADSGARVTHDALPSICYNNSQLIQLLQNLIGNAIKYHRPGEPPRVQIGCELGESDWVFSVSDNGLGFPPGDSERIFDVFTRLHGREYPGTGIGLAICKRIVERHGGRIWAESRIGSGSTFKFSVPL